MFQPRGFIRLLDTYLWGWRRGSRMTGLDHPVKQAKALIAIYLSALAAVLALHHLGVTERGPVAEIVLAVAGVACLGVSVLWFARVLREIGRELGAVCFDDGRCVALDDVVLIYVEPAGRQGNDTGKEGSAGAGGSPP
jgi:hypothetical protein